MTERVNPRLDAVTKFAHAFVEVALNRQVHSSQHRFVEESLDRLVRALRTCVDVGVEMPLLLQFDDRVIFHEGVPLESPSLQAGTLLRQCAERGIAMMTFKPHLTAAEVNRAFDLIVVDRNRDALQRQHRDRVLEAFGIRHVGFTLNTPGDPGDRHAAWREDAPPAADAGAVHGYQDLAEALQHNHALAYQDLELAIDEAAGVVERTLDTAEEPSSLLALAALDDVDRFTVGHSVRVALLALQVARDLGLDRDQLVSIGTAALMHDIGKSKVPQEILFKCGHLDDDEWREMAQHPRLGAQLLIEQQASIDPCAIGAAFCHHMAPHGRGYPQPALPILPSGTSHLIRVCDVFEALTSVRPYKQALTPFEAFAVMYRNEEDFEPDWLRVFTRAIGLFPNGTRVTLDDDSSGVILAQSKDPSRPIVRLLTGAAGGSLAADEPDRILVGTEVEGAVRRIRSLMTHERIVDVPEFELDAPLSTPHACLSEKLAHDAGQAARGSKQRQ